MRKLLSTTVLALVLAGCTTHHHSVAVPDVTYQGCRRDGQQLVMTVLVRNHHQQPVVISIDGTFTAAGVSRTVGSQVALRPGQSQPWFVSSPFDSTAPTFACSIQSTSEQITSGQPTPGAPTLPPPAPTPTS